MRQIPELVSFNDESSAPESGVARGAGPQGVDELGDEPAQGAPDLLNTTSPLPSLSAPPTHALEPAVHPPVAARAPVTQKMAAPRPAEPAGSSTRLLLGAALGLAAGLLVGLALHKPPPPAPEPPAEDRITTYVDGAERLAKAGRYDAAEQLLQHVTGTTGNDPALTVRIVTLTSQIGLEGGVLRMRRQLALGNAEAARAELERLAAFDPPPAELAKLRGEIDQSIAAKSAPTPAP